MQTMYLEALSILQALKEDGVDIETLGTKKTGPKKESERRLKRWAWDNIM
jgi:hypothetical protein